MVFEKLDKKLDKMGAPVKLPPIDGIAVVVMSYYLMRNTRGAFMKSLLIGGTHWGLHELITYRMEKNCFNSNVKGNNIPKRRSNRFR